MNSNRKNAQGFSLIELLVAVALSGVIFMGVSTLMISLFQSNSRVRQVDRIDQTKNDLVLELTNSIRWAKTVTFQTNSLVLVQDTKTNTYEYLNDRLYKNGDPISPSDVLIQNFEAKNFGASENLPLVEVSMDLADKQFPTVNNHLRFIVSQRVNTITAAP